MTGAKLAFVELDMGTMSHRRLKRKAAGYAAYAEAEAWRERHDFCPALLFLTTTGNRARSFLAAMDKETGRDSLLLTCGSDLARRLPRFATEPRWLLDAEDGEGVELLAALREARRPYDEERRRQDARRREEEIERERLRSDPEPLRAHLRRWNNRRDWMRALDPSVAAAFEIALERDGPMAEVERRAFLSLGMMFADPLALRLSDEEPTARWRQAFAGLAEHYRDAQLDRVADLAGGSGEGPALREVRRRLQSGELLGPKESSWQLDQKAADDRRSREEQERLASDYLAWREQEARRLAKAQGITARLRNRPKDFLDQIDRRSLRVCEACEEIAYPDPERAGDGRGRRRVASRCHFCGGQGTLEEIADEGAYR